MNDKQSFYSELENSIYRCMGYYDYDNSTHVLIHGGLQNSNIEAIICHEKTHMEIFSVTSYGLFQKLVASAILNSDTIDISTRNHLEIVLKTTIEESVLIHEGVATYCQYKFIEASESIEHAERFLKSINDIRSNGYEQIAEIVDKLRIGLLSQDDIAKQVAKCCLNTDIIEHFIHILNTGDSSIFRAIKENSPDQRLSQLYSFFTDIKMNKDLVNDINNTISKTVVESEASIIPVDENTVEIISSVIQQAISKAVFPIYERGNREKIYNRINEITETVNKEALEKGFDDFIAFSKDIQDIGECEGEVHFEYGSIPKGKYRIWGKCVELSVAKDYFSKYLESLGDKTTSYLHLFEPFHNNEIIAIKDSVKCAVNEEIIIINECQLVNGSMHINANEDIIRIRSYDLSNLMKIIRTDKVIIVSALKYFDSTLSENIHVRSILSEINSIHRIHYYLPDSTLSFLKYLSRIIFTNNGVKVVPCSIEEYKCWVIFFIDESKNCVFYTPISVLALKGYIDWAKTNLQSIESAKSDYREHFLREEYGLFIANHYLYFGY